MIKAVDFQLSDFIEDDGTLEYKSLSMEDLHGSDLVDNLVLLQFIELADVQSVIQNKYHMAFGWVTLDPTPEELKPIAKKYNIFLQRETNEMIAFIPLGVNVDDSMLQVDIPNYKFKYVFIAGCNYKLVTEGLSASVLSYRIADFRPLLVLRRLIIDCIKRGGTNMHMQSVYVDKAAQYHIRYRIQKRMEDSEFRVDKELFQRIAQATVSKLSRSSASDLDSIHGVTTQVADLFGDGSTELRVTGMQAIAGLCIDMAIQTVSTTTLTVEQLGFPDKDVNMIREIAKHRTGLTLVTGEQRSGKNTTILAIMNEMKDAPINVIEYSTPVEVRMPWTQVDYGDNIEHLLECMKLAKKQDIDLALLNEIPNKQVAFAVRDLVNSAIGVITTTHVNRIWHVPNKLDEFFGEDYKTIISQLNAVINQKMFRRIHCRDMQKRILQQDMNDFTKFAYRCGVRQYFVPAANAEVSHSLQPLTEILVITDEMKTAMLNFDEIWRAEQMLRIHIEKYHGTIENKLAEYINNGICELKELERMY